MRLTTTLASAPSSESLSIRAPSEAWSVSIPARNCPMKFLIWLIEMA